MVKILGQETQVRTMSNVNIVVGLSGVGKSTVLEEALKLAEEDYEIINYGDRMLDLAMERDLIDSRDEIKEISAEEQKDIQKKAAESIVEDAEDGNIIVDTHAAIQTPHGFLPGLPKWTVENLEPEHIVILDASAQEIYDRSTEDGGRNREHESVEGIELYQSVAREMAATGSVLTGAYLKTIENKAGKAQQAAQELVSVLE
ncbi:adenylate kinase [Candidatus Nanosalina sp. VS9-1]|uniref:adenylate kinase n=1 Tax=Candidatus Nanosalina sp. VS9-1 TaxID=3388566 RepID=UPI0039E19FB6